MNFRQFTLQVTNVVMRGGVHKVKSARCQGAYRPSDGAVRALDEDHRDGELRRVRHCRQGGTHHPLRSIENAAAGKRRLFRHDVTNVNTALSDAPHMRSRCLASASISSRKARQRSALASCRGLHHVAHLNDKSLGPDRADGP